MAASTAGVEVDLPCPRYPREDELNVVGEFNEELTAQASAVEVADTGVSRDEHSGGDVVLRWYPGRVVGACSGGLAYVDKARRWVLGRTSGSRPWSTVRILGRSTGPCCLIGDWGEQLGVVA